VAGGVRVVAGNVPMVGGGGRGGGGGSNNDPDHFVKVYYAKVLLGEDFQTFTNFVCGTYHVVAKECKGTHEPFRIGNEDRPRTHKYEGNLIKVKHMLEEWKSHECPGVDQVR